MNNPQTSLQSMHSNEVSSIFHKQTVANESIKLNQLRCAMKWNVHSLHTITVQYGSTTNEEPSGSLQRWQNLYTAHCA